MTYRKYKNKNIPQIGQVWEELDSLMWLALSNPMLDSTERFKFVQMVIIFSRTGCFDSSFIGHIENVPVHYFNDGWKKIC
jgi:hypothetical protein